MNRYIDRQTHEQIDQYIDTRTDRSAGPPAPAGAKSCAAMIYRAYTPQPHAYIDTYTCDICTDPQGLPRLLARNLVLRVGGAALRAVDIVVSLVCVNRQHARAPQARHEGLAIRPCRLPRVGLQRHLCAGATYMDVCTYVHVCVCVCMNVCMYVCMYVCMGE